MPDRLSQNGGGRLLLAGRTLKAGEEIEVIVGGNWHRATVLKPRRVQRLWIGELLLDTGRVMGAVGLIGRGSEGKKQTT